MTYSIGFDIGSSSVKAALLDTATGRTVATAQSPATEMAISSPRLGFAEQHPDRDWWHHVCLACRSVLQQSGVPPTAIGAVGIAYQMHGLVLLDADGEVLRPAIIWCDSRAVGIGHEAFEALGSDYCLGRLLNSPANFTASKFRWVIEHEPEIAAKTRYLMLPGDYIAYRMTGDVRTTVTGLSEGIFWDFGRNAVSEKLLAHYGIDADLIPPTVPAIGLQGHLGATAAAALGLAAGTPVTYRAGDQPNNALSLNANEPGEVAATGGTSGVVYGIGETLSASLNVAGESPALLVNRFAHVNHQPNRPRIGTLMCINGAGIQYAWVRRHLFPGKSYRDIEAIASEVAVGADGLTMLPFGNGAERILNNRDVGAQLAGLQLTRHGSAHVARAALEGIAFAFVYGIGQMQALGVQCDVMRVGNDNLFQSAIFSETIATLCRNRIEMVETSGATGAAKAAAVGAGLYNSLSEALQQQVLAGSYGPAQDAEPFTAAYDKWQRILSAAMADVGVGLSG